MKKIIIAASLSLTGLIFAKKNVLAETYSCGQEYRHSEGHTDCDCGNNEPIGNDWYCCGWWENDACLDENPEETESNPKDPADPDPDESSRTEPIVPEVNKEDLKNLNPLIQFGQDDENTDPDQALYTEDGSLNPSGVINRALNLLFPLAGIALFVMLVWGGFEMLTGAAKKQAQDSGKQRITAAFFGFSMLFIIYWLIQIIETITGVVILN